MRGSIVVIGALSRDRILDLGRPPGELVDQHRLGGVVTYAGLSYARHGGDVFSAFLRACEDRGLDQLLIAGGVRTLAGSSRATTAFTNQIDGDRRRQLVSADAGPIPGDLAAAAIRTARLIHLGPLLPGDLSASLHAVLAERPPNCIVALDVQGLTRVVCAGVVERSLAATAESWLGVADVIKGESAELQLIARGADVTSLAERFGLREVVETLGSRGGRVHTGTAEPVVYHAEPTSRAAHPTGAGDVFFAAYLWARESCGAAVAAAAAYAAGIAVRQVTGDFIDPAALRLGGPPISGSGDTRP